MNPTPSARSVKEAEEIVRGKTLEKELCELSTVDAQIRRVALALDQRERETWRDAAATIPKDRKTCEVHAGDTCSQFAPEVGKEACSYKVAAWVHNSAMDAARSALLSEAERRGMTSKPL